MAELHRLHRSFWILLADWRSVANWLSWIEPFDRHEVNIVPSLFRLTRAFAFGDWLHLTANQLMVDVCLPITSSIIQHHYWRTLSTYHSFEPSDLCSCGPIITILSFLDFCRVCLRFCTRSFRYNRA